MTQKGEYIKGVRVYHNGKRIGLDKVDGRKRNLKFHYYDGKGNKFVETPEQTYKKDFTKALLPDLRQISEETFIKRPNWLWRFETTEVIAKVEKVEKKYKLVELAGNWEYRKTVFGERRLVYSQNITDCFDNVNRIYNIVHSVISRNRKLNIFDFYIGYYYNDIDGKQISAEMSDGYPPDDYVGIIGDINDLIHRVDKVENRLQISTKDIALPIAEIILKISIRIQDNEE